MSGIFGYSFRSAEQTTLTQALEGLEYWNRNYGSAACDTAAFGMSAMGCHVEHFSERFPHGAPALETGGCKAVVDALLYNRDELTAALSLPSDSDISDEELLLRLIREKGLQALETVNGDFAGAIYDAGAGEWTLFRDHLGVRPLFVYLDEERFAFSTDQRGLLALPDADTRINDHQAYAYLTNRNFMSLQETDFARVRCALPGAVTRVRMSTDGFTLTEERYWNVRRKKIRFRTDEEYHQELRRLVTDAVHRRLDAIPGMIGAELSGGLDSCVIDILINRHGREGRYFSWSSDPERLPLRDGEDERRVIGDVCEQEGIECKYLSNQMRFGFDTMMAEAMPPYIDTLQLSYGSRWLRSEGARVVFSGHGGDEGVSHRCDRFELLYYGELGAFFKLFWSDAAGRPLRFPRAVRASLLYVRKILRKLLAKPDPAFQAGSPIHPELRTRAESGFREAPMYFSYAPHRYVMQGGTRYRLDNTAFQGASCGVRYLFPFVDYRVMDFALSIPRRLYLRPNQKRVIYREAFRDLMPQSLYDVGYKDYASSRGMKHNDRYVEGLRRERDMLLEQLDRRVWEGILDFDAIAALNPTDSRESLEGYLSSHWLYCLRRFLLIQNVREKAENWREFDERNKTV